MDNSKVGPLCVAMIAPPWYEIPPRKYGGIEQVVAGLADRLADRGHDVHLFGTGRDGTRAKFSQIYAEPPPADGSGTLPEVVQAAAAARLLAELGRDIRIDVVHDHSLAGALLARGRDIPTIVTMHWPAVGELARYFEEIGPTIGLVAISDSQRKLAPTLPWIGTVYNGIDVAKFPYRDVKDDYVAFLGRYGSEKAPHLAIDAAREAGLPIRLAGKCADPSELAYYAEHVEPRSGPDVEHLGQLGFAAKTELLAGARCLVFPICWEEPFGLVMIEAMACGTPVVALGRGSVPEIVEHGVTGFVCEDPSELPAAIRDAKKLDPAECRKRAEDRFDTSVMVGAYERLYRSVAV
jgi:glycosyltransferase involved in cell wall biosynthesis